jgi:hypothetical protein
MVTGIRWYVRQKVQRAGRSVSSDFNFYSVRPFRTTTAHYSHGLTQPVSHLRQIRACFSWVIYAQQAMKPRYIG